MAALEGQWSWLINVESLLAEFEQVRAAAMGREDRQQFNAANNAIKGKAVLTGNWVERAEIGQPGEFDHLSDEELLAAIKERMARLESGVMPDAGSGRRH